MAKTAHGWTVEGRGDYALAFKSNGIRSARVVRWADGRVVVTAWHNSQNADGWTREAHDPTEALYQAECWLMEAR